MSFFFADKKKDFVIYTAIFGDYDTLIDPEVTSNICDFVCFTNQQHFESDIWKIQLVTSCDLPDHQMNRKYKILAHRYLSQYSKSIYVDGNIKVIKNPLLLIDKYLKYHDLVIPRHEDRNCIYKEAEACVLAKKINSDMAREQIRRYHSFGFPKDYGLTENNIILRNHNRKEIIELMEAWWAEYLKGAPRDQLSLQYLLWLFKMNVAHLEEGPRRSTEYFKLKLHSVDKSKSFVYRLIREAHSKKYLYRHFKILSKIFSMITNFRDLANKILRHEK